MEAAAEPGPGLFESMDDPTVTCAGARIRLVTPGMSSTTLKNGALGTVVSTNLKNGRVLSAEVTWDAGVSLTLSPDEHVWLVLPSEAAPAQPKQVAILSMLKAARDAGVSPLELANAAVLNLRMAETLSHHGPMTLRDAFLLEQQLRAVLVDRGYIARNESPLVRLGEDAVAAAYGGLVEDDPTHPGWDVSVYEESYLSPALRIQVKSSSVPASVFTSWQVNKGEFDLLVVLAVSPHSGDILYAYSFERSSLDAVLPVSRKLSFGTAKKHGVDVTDRVSLGLQMSCDPHVVQRRLDNLDW